MVTIKDIAKKAGVSSATVSYVLNFREDVRITEPTREKVLGVANELGYQRNAFASALVSGSSRMIAVLQPNLHGQFEASVLACLQDMLAQDGYGVISTNSLFQASPDAASPRVTALPADGIIIWGFGKDVDEILSKSPNYFKAVVRLGPAESTNTDCVSVDKYTPTVEAIRHLVSTGRRRIVGITIAMWKFEHDMRDDAYAAAMAEAGMDPENIVLVGKKFRQESRLAVQEFVREHGCPDAIVCRNDDMAIGAYRGLKDMGISIPDDVAIVGCDGIEDTEYMDVPITTIVQPVEEMCALAWKFMRQRLADPTHPVQQAMIVPRLEIRASSAASSKQGVIRTSA